MKILIHVTPGPEPPTRVALAFLLAKNALDEGHSVTLWLAGDNVELMRDEVLDNSSDLGMGKLTGKLRELYEAIVEGGGRFYLSCRASQARGLTVADLQGKPAEFATPDFLARLSLEHDQTFTC